MRRLMGFQSVLAVFLIAAINPTLWAWSVEAHKAIALIAIQQLQGTNTAKRITALLGTLTLADIATCADEVRDLEEYKTPISPTCKKIFPKPPTGTAPWHFVNSPIKGATFNPTTADVNAACAGNCALTKIPVYLAVLSKAKPTDTAAQKLAEQQALSFVVHFIGDIHQPLHAADRDGDSGGNAEHVSFFGTDSSGKLKLHTIWDNEIVSRVSPTETLLTGAIAMEISQASGETDSGDPMTWALQSYGYARDVAYNGIPAEPAHSTTDVATLGADYQNKAAPVVRIQIARAGVRLADALKKALP